MPVGHETLYLDRRVLMTPLLERLSEIAWRNCRMGLIVVFPDSRGWAQVCPSAEDRRPEFCRFIQSTGEGVKHCRMCHLLVSIAAGNGGDLQPRCHAGASILLNPVAAAGDEGIAVVSTCMSIGDDEEAVWREVRHRGAKLGIPPERLDDKRVMLPHVAGSRLELARELVAAAAEAVGEIWRRAGLEARLARAGGAAERDSDVRVVVRRELKGALMREAFTPEGKPRRGSSSLVVEVVSDLIRRKPEMPLTLQDIAAAVRVTPNHFSMMFHRHHSQRFSDFVTERRMDMARDLLRDLTLNISEVAARSGFDDAGYFARRFKQKHGVTPREWRAMLKPG